ncbi:bifunctional 4-hydroxy-2-oxoglutarate aldolase/2-dehydro-3-deoxy-phosphogluconate aldolase [Lentibacillus sp. CBA3610]|uniref:bifunctional 4-hydroxy-2-oxoglutarate aldolase/2-dehydro-3-deoxy-phosphogluconate aldolase n=1 Tax=Lentibacillus sp. CBA3610 TaxID=2518176 RepID=UPI001595410B|nr:bifunctional 4-hydroxy-2-oxoglutarate aldolase/2-dehydro-3-deoxy-phosphogluconate aldolase [Lentibacillus sp. CBA3610]QKY70247.1 bifunctional 4-hydroxy-2-oxoglutarate aldolase/2-dehydro-3-deoxy-phosphogluconate aldolase [Lentibacillus sp. CBA3610]
MLTIESFRRDPIVAVIRHSTPDTVIPVVQALKEGGVRSIELTAETKGIAGLIEKVRHEFGDDIMIGGGTILDPETAKEVISAGAEFVVSPTLNVDTIKVAKRYGKLAVPGALTPTEILTAYEHGADMVKVFPANMFGPSYIKSIHGPLPQIPLMVTGGITLDNMQAYLEAGSVAVGVGSNLADPRKLYSEKDFEDLKEKARTFTDKVTQ